jgi:hypothetical protein
MSLSLIPKMNLHNLTDTTDSGFSDQVFLQDLEQKSSLM